MKLCVLTSKLVQEPLYEHTELCLFLYHIPIDEYKKCILKGIVHTDETLTSRACFVYARDVLKGRFELGEESISKDLGNSFMYATRVLKERFILGESVISTDIHYSLIYARDVLKGKFELGEKVLSEMGIYGFRYAVDVTQERFLLGEQAIKNSGYCSEYEEYFNIKL